MYVVGKDSDNYGTIIPALYEGIKKELIGRIGIVTTSADSARSAILKANDLAEKMHVNPELVSFPKEGADSEAYLGAVEQFKPDCVVISVPDHLHAQVSIPLLQKGIHCLMVKPMATTVEEAQAMTAAAKKSKVVAQVEFHKRLDESNLLLYDAVKSESLGELLYAVIEYSQQKRIPRDMFRSWAEKSTVFQYLGIHYVDLLQFVTGFRPLRATAWGQKGYLKSQGIDTWDAMQVTVEWQRTDGGTFVSNHNTNWVDPDETSAVSDQKINVVGTKGRYQADQKNRGVQLVRDTAGINDVNPYFSSSRLDPESKRTMYEGYGIRSVLQFIYDVIDYEAGDITLEWLEKTRPTFQNCVVSTAVVEAAHTSLMNNNHTVEVNFE